MADMRVACPLCTGRGEILYAEISERIATPELRERLEARIVEILDGAALAGVTAPVRNFEKEVHQWNPQLPIWRRSPKE